VQAIKALLPLRQGARDPFPPFTMRTSRALYSPLVTSVHLQYQTTRRRAITSKEGLEPE
jgi:hypothetical protein